MWTMTSMYTCKMGAWVSSKEKTYYRLQEKKHRINIYLQIDLAALYCSVVSKGCFSNICPIAHMQFCMSFWALWKWGPMTRFR